MFVRDRLIRDGAEARALVLEKKVYASGYSTGRTSACRYALRVTFPDGTTTEIVRRAWSHRLARALVGDVIPVRFDPSDRTKVEIDGPALEAHYRELERQVQERAIADGERTLDA